MRARASPRRGERREWSLRRYPSLPSVFFSSGPNVLGRLITAAALKAAHYIPSITFLLFQRTGICPWQSHKRMAPVPLAHIAQRPLTTVSEGERSVRMMCVLELLCWDATAHIKRTGALRGSGAEPLCERNGCHTLPPGIPSPSQRPALPLLCPALPLLLPVPCLFPLAVQMWYSGVLTNHSPNNVPFFAVCGV